MRNSCNACPGFRLLSTVGLVLISAVHVSSKTAVVGAECSSESECVPGAECVSCLPAIPHLPRSCTRDQVADNKSFCRCPKGVLGHYDMLPLFDNSACVAAPGLPTTVLCASNGDCRRRNRTQPQCVLNPRRSSSQPEAVCFCDDRSLPLKRGQSCVPRTFPVGLAGCSDDEECREEYPGSAWCVFTEAPNESSPAGVSGCLCEPDAYLHVAGQRCVKGFLDQVRCRSDQDCIIPDKRLCAYSDFLLDDAKCLTERPEGESRDHIYTGASGIQQMGNLAALVVGLMATFASVVVGFFLWKKKFDSSLHKEEAATALENTESSTTATVV